jgi:aminoglycoside phosphotransferase (APT) family kinase protein
MVLVEVVIDVSLVTRLIAAQFPEWAHLPISVVANSGWDNRTFHLGEEMLVRMPSGEHYAKAVAKEQRWLPRLAPYLPRPIPQPLALGKPGPGYPWPWSIYGWLEGEIATRNSTPNLVAFAEDLAEFLLALQQVETTDGPTRKMRGGSLELWREQAETAIDLLADQIDTQTAIEIWQLALDAPFEEKPVWYHGDVAAGNLLVQDGALSAVIDFGGLGVGDPGCDMAIAWTFLEPQSRQAFRERLGVSHAVWNRGRGWVLWKGMIVMADMIQTNAIEAASAGYAVEQLISDHRANG